MELDREYIEFRLDVAREKGAKDSQVHLADQLESALLDGDLNTGVKVDFGRSDKKFKSAIDILGLTSLIELDDPMHVHQAIVSSGNTSSFIPSAIPELVKLPLTQALEVMQICDWDTAVGLNGRLELNVPSKNTITSQLVLAHTLYGSEHGEMRADTSKLGATLKASYFAGALVVDEHGELLGGRRIAEFLDERKNTDPRAKIASEFASFIGARGFELVMPHSIFSISLGLPAGGNSTFESAFITDVHTHKTANIA